MMTEQQNKRSVEWLSKQVRVFASMVSHPDYFHYSTFTLTSPRTNKSITISGYYDDDMCEDIRMKISLSTNRGEFKKVAILISIGDCYRWIASYNEMVFHYTP